MKIDNEFTVSVPVEEAWKVLTDLEGIAPCLPGARLTGVAGDVYSGKVKIKVGPVVSEYAGTARFVEKDDTAYRAVIDAKGKDSRGAGNAAAAIHASLRPDGEHTIVTVNTDLTISGKIAQFGSGMIKEISGKLLGQFVQNLEAKLQARGEDDGSGAATGTEAARVTTATGATTVKATGPGPVSEGDSAVEEPASSTRSASSVEASSGVSGSEPATAVSAPVVDSSPGPGEPKPPALAAETSRQPSAAERSAAAAVLAAETAPSAGTPMGAFAETPEPEPLDLMGLAGGSIYKRLIPVAVGVVVVVAVVIYAVTR